MKRDTIDVEGIAYSIEQMSVYYSTEGVRDIEESVKRDLRRGRTPKDMTQLSDRLVIDLHTKSLGQIAIGVCPRW